MQPAKEKKSCRPDPGLHSDVHQGSRVANYVRSFLASLLIGVRSAEVVVYSYDSKRWDTGVILGQHQIVSFLVAGCRNLIADQDF